MKKPNDLIDVGKYWNWETKRSSDSQFNGYNLVPTEYPKFPAKSRRRNARRGKRYVLLPYRPKYRGRGKLPSFVGAVALRYRRMHPRVWKQLMGTHRAFKVR